MNIGIKSPPVCSLKERKHKREKGKVMNGVALIECYALERKDEERPVLALTPDPPIENHIPRGYKRPSLRWGFEPFSLTGGVPVMQVSPRSLNFFLVYLFFGDECVPSGHL